MATWLRRNSSKKKYVFNHEEERMEQILEGVFLSTHPDKVKEVLISRVCDQGSLNSHSEATVKGVLQVSTKWILEGTSDLQVSSGFRLLQTWGDYNRMTFHSFFSPHLIMELLTRQCRIPANVPLLIREAFRVIGCTDTRLYCMQAQAQAVESSLTKFVSSTQERLAVHNLSLLLEEFKECIPSDEREAIDFCIAVLNHLSAGVHLHEKNEVDKFITYSDQIAKTLGMIWRLQSANVLTLCLDEIFKIISVPKTMEQAQSTTSLAAVVKYIPLEMANRVVKVVVTDSTVSDHSISFAIHQILDWMRWSTAENVDLWLMCFLTELAAAKKYNLLVSITEASVEQLLEYLSYPKLRTSACEIFGHLMLGFQHSSVLFHKCLEKIAMIIQTLKEEKTSESMALMLQLSLVTYCLIYQYSGFPDLYEPLLEIIKDVPQPRDEQIKSLLAQAKWSSQASCPSQTSCLVVTKTVGPPTSVSTVRPSKLEPGKTGLENLGNTCYMNSIVQALYMCDQFRRGVLGKAPHVKENLLVKLQYVFAYLSHSNRPTLTPTQFLQASRPPWFQPGHQQDCSEFLKHLLNQLHEDEKSLEKRPSTGSITSGNFTLDIKTLMKADKKSKSEKPAVVLTAVKKKMDDEMSGSVLSSNGKILDTGSSESGRSLVERTFKGKVQTTMRCLTCQQESSTVETFVDIPLAFPNSSRPAQYPHKNLVGGSGAPCLETEPESMQGVEIEHGSPTDEAFSLKDLLSFYLKPEKLTGDNKYQCDRCGKLQDGERSIQIIESPEYLILTLLRFSYDTKLHTRTKIFQDVLYPLTLSLPVHGDSSSCKDAHQYSQNVSENQMNTVTSGSRLEDIAKLLAPKSASSYQGCQSWNLYSLSNVIVHSGTSSECGHYYCYARHSQAGQIKPELLDTLPGNLQNLDFLPDKWYNFNDSRISLTTFSSFSNVTKKFSKDTAYVLIYRKLQVGNYGLGFDIDPALRPDLREAVIKDNEAYLREQEIEARQKEELQRRRQASSINSTSTHSWHGKDHDDNDDNPHGGNFSFGDGMGNGLDISGSRFVY